MAVITQRVGKVLLLDRSVEKGAFYLILFITAAAETIEILAVLFKDSLTPLVDLRRHFDLVPRQHDRRARQQDALAFQFEALRVEPVEGCRGSHQVEVMIGKGCLLGCANDRHEIWMPVKQFFSLGAHIRVGLHGVNLRSQSQ